MNLPAKIEDGSPLQDKGLTLREMLPDPLSVWALLRRNLTVFAIAFIVIVLGTMFWASRQTPSYVATATLQVQPRENVVNVKSVSPDLPATTDLVDTRVRLVASEAVARRAAATYDRAHPLAKSRNADEMNALASRLLGMVFVARSGSTYLIDVTARSNDPGEAAEVANIFAEEFVELDRETKVSANVDADNWLRRRSEQLARDATAADASLQQYKIRNGLLSSTGRSGAENQISNLDSEIAQAEADLAEKEGRLNAARRQLLSGGGGADVGAALGSGTIGNLRTSEAQISARVAQLSATYGDQYPDMLKARKELADIRKQIQLEINRILSNLDAEVRVASSRLASLRGSRSESTGVLATNNAAQVGLAELERRADAAKAIYETFLHRSRETSAQQGLQQADTRVALLATPPFGPDFPNWKLVSIFALGGGLLMGLLAIAIAEYLQGGVRTKDDVEQRLRIRYAGSIPSLETTTADLRTPEAPHDYVVSHPFSTFVESLRALRAFMLLGRGAVSSGARSIAIVSPLPQDGKTTTAVCLARISAMGGVRTVLVDCDLRRRGASELLNCGAANGLYDYFAGTKTLDEALVIDEATGLAILSTTETPQSALDPLTSTNVSRLIAELKQRFDVVIFDTAPLLGVADSRVIAAGVDRVLLITRWSKTSIRACEAAVDMLLDAGAKISGMALTQVDVTRYASTGHSDIYRYHKKFRGYYIN